MKARNASFVSLTMLLGIVLFSQGQVRPEKVKPSAPQGSEDRVRAFRRRHRDNRSTESSASITLAQAQQLIQTRNYYVSLSPRQTYVDGRGYLNFIFPSSPDTAEFN